MSRVVTATVTAPELRRLAAAPRDQLDPAVQALVERAAADAYERGRSDGRAEGESAAVDAVRRQADEARAALATALEDARRRAEAAREELVDEAVALAFAMAEVILGHEPHDGGAVLTARVREALDRIEDPQSVVHVNSGDLRHVSEALHGVRHVTVAADPALRPGEARIDGGWADAELTHAAAFAAIRRELDAS